MQLCLERKALLRSTLHPRNILNQRQLLQKARQKTRIVVFTHAHFEQIYLQTLVTTQNCTKMLRNGTFVVHICITPKKKKKGETKKFFLATFVRLSLKSNF